MIGSVISHYRILEKLGEGGMGVVYKAQDTRLDRIVALKFLPPRVSGSDEDLARFRQEAKAISALNHPNIATIFEFGESDGQQFIALEFCSGGTLKQLVRRSVKDGVEIPVSDILSYGIQMAEGLGHAHREGIVHRDVKSDNMMLTKEGRIKITDFGLAKFRGGADLTRAGSTLGTAAYMSPEQIRGEDVDGKSDLFSLGVVLYELLTLRTPFRGDHEAALAYSIVNEQPVPVSSVRPGIPPALAQVIDRCLEKDPSKRYQRGEELAADMRSFQSTPSATVAVPARRSSLPWVLAAAAVIVVSVGLYLVFGPSRAVSVNGKTIAVLPFSNMSGDPQDEYFSDGMTEDILTQLSKISDLKVISRTSVMQYKGTKKTIREIGEELNAGVILEGSVQRAGDEVRITAQLIDARSDEHLWAESYDKQFREVFAIQSDVAQKIAGALRARLSQTEKERIEKAPTDNLEAYSCYLAGREAYYRYTKEENESAIRLFDKSLALDPKYALAFAGLADAYAQRVGRFGFHDSWIDSSIAMSNHALAIDPKLPEAYKSLGLAFEFRGTYSKAIEANRKAIALNPNLAPAIGNLADELGRSGDLVSGVLYNLRAHELTPTRLDPIFSLAGFWYLLGDDSTADAWYGKGTTLGAPGQFTFSQRYVMERSRGNESEAEAAWRNMVVADSANPLAMYVSMMEQQRRGNVAYAAAIAAKLLAMDSSGYHVPDALHVLSLQGGSRRIRSFLDNCILVSLLRVRQGDESNTAVYAIARLYAVSGNTGEAYAWLKKAIDAGFRDERWARVDPCLSPMRNEKRFLEMMDELKTGNEAMRTKLAAMIQKNN